jgi:hypothetical protein
MKSEIKSVFFLAFLILATIGYMVMTGDIATIAIFTILFAFIIR